MLFIHRLFADTAVVIASSVTLPPPKDVICPPPEAYAPCYCGPTISSKPNVIQLGCDANLTDSKLNDILDAFLSTPDISTLITLDLRNNQLMTRVPSQVKLFNHLLFTDLYKNAITSIESGTFKFNDKGWHLVLASNQLTTFPPGAFIG